MGKIFLLDEATANQIAAGEVVERPAAAVKELVENALDAGARQIKISVAGGGLASISVADDGSGIAAEDVPLAILRHATSKIRLITDLANIRSLGFRGEALPSIAAVSRLRVVTRQPDDLAGAELVVHGGKIISQGEIGCPVGTEIRVEGLFYNTPARLKFLKSEAAETAKITDTVQRLALAWPDVSFSYSVNGREQLVTAGNGQLLDVLFCVLGRQNGRHFFPLAWQGPLLSLQGVLGRPGLARANRNLQFFYINRRPVRSPLLSDALQSAYLTLLPPRRFPAAVVFLELDPVEVDVNVHPAKREVRFAREQDIYRQFLSGARQALRGESLTGEIPLPAARPFSFPNVGYKPTQGTIFSVAEAAAASETALPVWEGERTPTRLPKSLPTLRPLGQLAGMYILAQSEAGDLYIVDQHAAHERVLYDLFAQDVQDGKLAVQEVIPQTVEVDPQNAAALVGALKVFARAGLSLDTFGHNSFILRTVPLFFRQNLNQDDILMLVQAASVHCEATQLLGEILKMMACKAAIRAGQLLSREEMAHLLASLAETEQPFTCPHGRPAVMSLAAGALAAHFGRR